MLGALLVACLQATSLGQDNGTREEAKAMVDAAVEHLKKAGPEQAIKDFSDKSNKIWQKEGLSAFAYSTEGGNMVHGANDKLIGTNLIELTDPSGKPLTRELRAAAQKSSCWADYDWPHPQSKKIASKVFFVRKLPNLDGCMRVGV